MDRYSAYYVLTYSELNGKPEVMLMLAMLIYADDDVRASCLRAGHLDALSSS